MFNFYKQYPNNPECLKNSYCNHANKAKPLKKKFNFKTLKKDTCSSLNEVECFLNNFTDFIKYIKLINLLKK